MGLAEMLLEIMGSPVLSCYLQGPQMSLRTLLPLCYYYPIPAQMSHFVPAALHEAGREGTGKMERNTGSEPKML